MKFYAYAVPICINFVAALAIVFGNKWIFSKVENCIYIFMNHES